MQQESIFDDIPFERKITGQDRVKIAVVVFLLLLLMAGACNATYRMVRSPITINTAVRASLIAFSAISMPVGVFIKNTIGWIANIAVFYIALITIVWLRTDDIEMFTVVDITSSAMMMTAIVLMNSRSLKRFYKLDTGSKLIAQNIIALALAFLHFGLMRLLATW